MSIALSIRGSRLEGRSCDLCPGNPDNRVKVFLWVFLDLAHHDGGKENKHRALQCFSLSDKEEHCRISISATRDPRATS